ncbi:hypothetical protein U0358_06490 [Idiomarina sp. PL1-037]|uniref:hypothetical protein n=1 Tax=Idiomarina sp. PL1-037 TaxID=3095365 RepID=UPI002ACC2DCF|nr:hypothetical protein [Idiomarina sp. PL1-037]WQC54198.1 hypothetical protein U0358_06490 [Idiomarina sp. PL1-037]
MSKHVPDNYSPNWLQSIDQRTSVAQSLKRRYGELAADLGGESTLSYQQRALIDRALFLEFHLQQEEVKLASGAEFDSGRWVQSCNALLGIFKTLGLQRQAREVTLASYVKAKGDK